MKRILLVSALALSSTLSFAQSTNDGNMDVSATAISGCNISGEDYVLGDISESLLASGATLSSTKNLKLQCSKGINVTLKQVGGGAFNVINRMKPINVVVRNWGNLRGKNESVLYDVIVDQIQTNGNYTLISKPSDNLLTADRYNLGTAHVELTVKTGEAINLPITIKLNYANITTPRTQGFELLPGAYGDILTYTFTF